jgi:hypothetical protein
MRAFGPPERSAGPAPHAAGSAGAAARDGRLNRSGRAGRIAARVPADRPPTSSPSSAPPHRWIAIAVLMALTLALRVGYLLMLAGQGHVYADVDQYLAKGASLVASGGFRWTFDAVAYPWGGRVYALPPLYSLYLGPFAAWPSYPVNAFAGLAVVNTAVIPLIVATGRRLHSDRTGVVAALLYACWGADVAAYAAIRQEALYIPLVIVATWALVRALDGAGGRYRFAVAGAAFGLAALCRSMPIYYVAAAAAGLALRDWRGGGWRQAGHLAGGFAALTVPYSVALSIHLGEPTLIENHGGILVAHRYLGGGHRQVPGFTTVVLAILQQIWAAPGAFAAGTLDQARSLVSVSGGRFVQEGIVAATAQGAVLWKLAAHLLIDVPWVLALVLAPIGAAMARLRPAVAALLAWTLLNVALTAVTGFGGSRLRGPFEIHLVLLAAVALAGPWRVARWPPLLAGAAVAAVLAGMVAPQLDRGFRARGNYGVRWTAAGAETRATVTGASGANVLAMAGGLEVEVTNPGTAPVVVDLRVEGTALVQAATLDPGAHRVAIVPTERPALTFVEVSAVDAQRRPATVEVRAIRR